MPTRPGDKIGDDANYFPTEKRRAEAVGAVGASAEGLDPILDPNSPNRAGIKRHTLAPALARSVEPFPVSRQAEEASGQLNRSRVKTSRRSDPRLVPIWRSRHTV